MNFLVSGFTGYVGGRLVPLLLSKGHSVFGIHRRQGEFVLSDLEAKRDIYAGKFEELEFGIKETAFDAFINLAAETTKSSDFKSITRLCEANVTFNSLLARLAVEVQAKQYVYISTYSTSMNGRSFSPQTFYAATKYSGEKILEYFRQAEGLNVKILQFYDIYGPNHHPQRIISLLIDSLRTGRKIHLTPGEQEFSPLYVEDACAAIYHGMFETSPDEGYQFSVRGSEIFLLSELPDIVANCMKLPWRNEQIRNTLGYREREIFKIAPLYPALPRWEPKFNLVEGILEIIADSNPMVR